MIHGRIGVCRGGVTGVKHPPWACPKKLKNGRKRKGGRERERKGGREKEREGRREGGGGGGEGEVGDEQGLGVIFLGLYMLTFPTQIITPYPGNVYVKVLIVK